LYSACSNNIAITAAEKLDLAPVWLLMSWYQNSKV